MGNSRHLHAEWEASSVIVGIEAGDRCKSRDSTRGSSRGHKVVRSMALWVLIIEDELEFAEFIISGLTEEGCSVEHAVDGKQGCAMIEGRPWDLVLLDWSLPHQDGLTLLRRYRHAGGEAPIIFLTARDEVDDRVMGLD